MAHETVSSVLLNPLTNITSSFVAPPAFSTMLMPFDAQITLVDMSGNSGNGTIVLQTKVQNVLTGGIFVGLYSRDTKKLFMATTSDAGGTATFNNVSLEIDKFFAVSLVDSVYNGLVIDRLEGV